MKLYEAQVKWAPDSQGCADNDGVPDELLWVEAWDEQDARREVREQGGEVVRLKDTLLRRTT